MARNEAHVAPTNADEYQALYVRNSPISGYGFEVTQHLACPFCAAPGFMKLKPAEMATWSGRVVLEATCEHCGRSGRSVFERDESGSSMGFAQTGGDDPPEWLQPAPPDERDARR